MRAPRLGHVELLQESAAGDAEQVRHVALVAEGDQRRMHPVLQRRAVLDEMQAPPGDLPLAAQLQRGQPDHRHQVPERQLGQNAGVDLVGLARQRREPLDLLGVGDQHLPAMRDQLVVDEPGAVHRLDHGAHRLPVHGDPASEPVQAVAIRGRREAVDRLPLIGDQADINAFATQIQTNVQHEHSPLSTRPRAGLIQPTAYRHGVVGSLSRTARPRGLQPRAPYLCCSLRRADLLPPATPPGGRLHRIPLQAPDQPSGWLPVSQAKHAPRLPLAGCGPRAGADIRPCHRVGAGMAERHDRVVRIAPVTADADWFRDPCLSVAGRLGRWRLSEALEPGRGRVVSSRF